MQESTVGKLNARKSYALMLLGAVFLTHAIQTTDKLIKFDIWDTAGIPYPLRLSLSFARSGKISIACSDVLQGSEGGTSDRYLS